MTVKPVATTHEDQVIGFLKDDEFHVSAAEQALKQMRAMFSHSGPASRYNKLSLRARAAICYTAKLRPSEYANRDLDDMTMDEREAIRRAILELKNIAAGFDGALNRREFQQTLKPQTGHHPEPQHSQPFQMLHAQAQALNAAAETPNRTPVIQE